MLDQIWHQDTAGVAETAESDDNFGFALSTGDFNNDGNSDLAAFSDGINIVYGSSSGLSVTTTIKNQLLSWGGQSLSTGDYNNDGYSDIVIGNPFDSAGASSATPGSATIVHGSQNGLAAGVLPTQFAAGHGKAGSFGASLASGDFNGDDFIDLAVGEPGFNPNYMLGPAIGGVSIVYGSGTVLGGFISRAQDWTQDSPNVEDVAEAGERFGSALASG